MRRLRLTLWAAGMVLVGAVVLAVALCAALWFTSARPDSLDTTLGLVARAMPAGQTLSTRNVQGSLQDGGSIQWLRWQQGALSVEVHDLHVTWQPSELLQKKLVLPTLSARLVHIDDRRPPSPDGSRPPVSLALPLQVDAHWTVETLEWNGAAALTATALSGHYVFDSLSHRIDGGSGQIASGSYQINARVDAHAPMTLDVQVKGTVQATLPKRKTPLNLAANATLSGNLANPDSRLQLVANLSPVPVGARVGGNLISASLQAELQPWQKQPIAQAKAAWQGLDPATLWPDAPRAQLSGEATVNPEGPAWKARVQMRNAQSGPWDTRRLPLERLEANLRYANERWWIDSLEARGAGGSLQAQGEFSQANAGWQGKATLTGVDLAAVDSRFAAGAVSGTLNAQQEGASVVFDAVLAGTAKDTRTRGLRLSQLLVKGRWTAPLLDIESLALRTDSADLGGALRLNTTDLNGTGQLTLNAPGITANASGQLSADQGAGKLQVALTDATLAARWVASLPAAPAALATLRIAGEGTIDARWTGGWKAGTHAGVNNLHLTAVAQVPRLVWTPDGSNATPWRLREGRVSLAGTPNALQLDITGQAEQGSRALQLQSSAHITHTPAGPWEMAWNSAKLGVQDKAYRTGATQWTLQLDAPVISTLQSSGTALRINAGAGALRLTSPSSNASSGSARISWQPAMWESLGPASTWRSTGNITEVPLAWLEALSPMPLTELGLRGNVVLGGQWDARNDGTLRLQAHLERTAGDLQLSAEGDDSSLLSAGVRVARLEVATQGTELKANMRWDSERAGQLQAEFATRLQLEAGNWSWPADAALSGRVKAQLPRVGAWSVLAPPGWRMRGTLDADATLAGTRLRPLWSGKLQATDLAIRSVVDGIDFSRGTLRARLEGERLDIEEFTAQGAGAPQGGILAAQGFVTWQATEGAATDRPLRDRLRMEINATASALRVSTRSDRRLALSGYLAARLGKDQLVLRGALTADQALFILPEDTAPRLGDDVRVQAPVKTVTESAPDAERTAPRAANVANAKGTPMLLDVMMLVDLGKDFQVRGNGISTLLEGAVELRSTGRTGAANSSVAFTPVLNGTLRTALGTYKAYGQQLDIEEGELRFTGPVNNPSINILAIRPNLTQRVGVQISGTALLPVVRLYADPDLAESEKLSWLVLGRSGANGGAEAAMLQQAAMALLGSKGGGVSTQIADAFGLDEISVRGGSDGSAPGSTSSNTLGATGATVTLGKRLSRDFYVAYERSLAGTLGTLSIFYDLSKRFTLRAQTGEQSAVDVIFTVRYD